jgi:hypothetical protein
MQKFLLCFLAVLVVSSITIAQMKLQLLTDIVVEDIILVKNSVLNKSEATSTNDLPTKLLGDEGKLIPGSIMIGLMGDVTFPFGEEFKNYAGTGWSVHGFGGYVLNPLVLGLKIGYIKFGEVETDYGLLGKSSAINEGSIQTNNQTIFAVILQYLLANLDPTCLGLISSSFIQPYVAIAMCLILKTFTYQFIGQIGLNKVANTMQLNEEFEESSTIFGISPSVGTYFQVSDDIRLILSADYYYLFDKADEQISGSANINYLSLTFGGAYSF